MKKMMVQIVKDQRAESKREREEYGGPGYRRNRPEVLAKFQSCYDDSGRDFEEVAKDAIEKSGRFLSWCNRSSQQVRETLQFHQNDVTYSYREDFSEARKNIKKLGGSTVGIQPHLGMLENILAKHSMRVPLSEQQTVMAGVTNRFSRDEARAMYQSIFHFGPLEEEEDFDHVRSQNDVVIALSYRHQPPNRMSEPMFHHVLDNIFHAVHVMKPQVTHIRLWVDAVASRRAQGRKWVSKGVLPYTVFPVCVCDPQFSLRYNRTWINIETILGLMGKGLMVFDQQMVREMGLVYHASEATQSRDFYFQGARYDSVRNLQSLASIVLRGALDQTEITWKSDWIDIRQLLSRAAVADNGEVSYGLLSEDNNVERPINFQARSLIETLLGESSRNTGPIPFMEVRPLNTHIEYVWDRNTPYLEAAKLLVAIKHLGSINRAVVECAANILQKDQPVWLMIAFEAYQVAVEFHKGWAERGYVRLVHVLINARAFEGQIIKSFITCFVGKDVNYIHASTHKFEYMSNAINVMKVISELQRIGAVTEQSVLQKFWFVKNKDVSWTMGPIQ